MLFSNIYQEGFVYISEGKDSIDVLSEWDIDPLFWAFCDACHQNLPSGKNGL